MSAKIMGSKSEIGCQGLPGEDKFDRLPDAVVCTIFNRVKDAKSLCRCLAVSKRFSSLIPQTKTISFTIIHRNPNTTTSRDCSYPPTRSLIRMLTMVLRYLVKTHHNLRNIILRNPTSAVPVVIDHMNHDVVGSSYTLPDEPLRNFKNVHSLALHIVLPCLQKQDEISCGTGDLLFKWKAQVQNGDLVCVILLAESFYKTNHSSTTHVAEYSEGSSDEHNLRIQELANSCFGDAVARCGLIYYTALNHPTLGSFVISDANKGGKVHLGKNDLDELMRSTSVVCTSIQVPIQNLEINLWYAPLLELRLSTHIMEKATLIAMSQPGIIERVDEAFLTSAFEEETKVIREAVTELRRKKKETFEIPFNPSVF